MGYNHSEAKPLAGTALSVSAGGVRNRVAAAERALKYWLQAGVDWDRLYQPLSYRKWLDPTDYPTAVSFLAFENGKPIVIYIKFTVNRFGTVTSSNQEKGIPPLGKFGFFVQGYKSFSDEVFAGWHNRLVLGLPYGWPSVNRSKPRPTMSGRPFPSLK